MDASPVAFLYLQKSFSRVRSAIMFPSNFAKVNILVERILSAGVYLFLCDMETVKFRSIVKKYCIPMLRKTHRIIALILLLSNVLSLAVLNKRIFHVIKRVRKNGQTILRHRSMFK